MTQIIKKGMVLFMSAVMFLCCGAFDFSYVDAATWNPVFDGKWTDANTFTIDVGETVKTNENTKSLIKWKSWDGDVALADGDTVTAEGNKLKIHVAAGYSSVKNNYALNFAPGSITNENGDTLGGDKTVYTSSVDSAITGLSAASTKIPAEGGKVTVNVAGRLLDMGDSFSFKVYIDGSAPTDFIYTDFKVNSATSGTLTFTAPANTDAKEHVYTVKAKKGFNSPYADIDQSFQMTQATGSGEAPSKDPAITSLSYSATSFTSAGGQVTVTVKGSNLKDLTKENLPFTPKLMTSVYNEGLGKDVNTDVLGDYTWTAVDDTQGTITFTLPENTETTDKTYTFRMKNGANGYYDTAELSGTDQTLTVAGKAATVKKFTPVIEESNWIDKNTIKIHFAEPVSLTSDAKAKIQFAYQPLAAKDMVTSSGNDVIITIAGGYKYGALIFGEGALTNSKGDISNSVTAYPSATSKVTKVAFNKTSFDSKGGELVGTIKGTQLDKSSPAISFQTFRNNDKLSTADMNVDVTVKDPSTAEFRVVLPENKTDKPVSYRILPRVDGINAYTAYIKGYDVITVLPAGADPNASVISSITISGGNDVDDAPDVLETTMDSGVVSYKLNVYIRGANLSSKKTAVKVVDENGIEWPAHPVFECGATIRWQNSASYLPELDSKNEQAIEMLAPRALGKDHTFKLYFAPDGKNFQDSPVGTVIVHNDHVIDIPSGFTYEQLTQLKSVKVKYVDEQGNEIAKTDEYPAYAVTELYNLGIKAKDIKGYTLKTSTPDPDTLKEYLKMPDQNEDGQYTNANYFVAHLGDDPVITYIYSRDKTVPADQYWVAEGDKATWTKGSDSGLKIRFQYGDKAADEANGTFDKFTGKLTLDGRDLKADQFTASKGSLNVELNPELMNSLSTGKHTLTAEFTDGSATAEFTVAAAGTSGGNGESSNVQPGKGGKTTVQTVKTVKTVNAVRTGDESSLGLYAVVLMIAAGLALVISYRRKASK